MAAYNVVEFAAVEEPGTPVGADVVFPLLVHLCRKPRSADVLRRILRFMDVTAVTKRMREVQAKGAVGYALLSLTAALDAIGN
jgi:hypothetical protein